MISRNWVKTRTRSRFSWIVSQISRSLPNLPLSFSSKPPVAEVLVRVIAELLELHERAQDDPFSLDAFRRSPWSA